MSEQLSLFTEPTPQPKWDPPRGPRYCGRDPDAGPGSCSWWWEMCPRAEYRQCFILLRKQQQEVKK